MTDQMTRSEVTDSATTGAAGEENLPDALRQGSFEALLNEIGRLTRELHDAATCLAPDDTQLSQTQRLILDARERLGDFLKKSAQATDNALDAVETMIPLSHQVVEQAEAMREALDAGLSGAAATEQTRHFIDTVEHGARKLRTGLSDVLVAQEYQDITGDVVQRAVELIDEIERKQLALLQAGASAPAAPQGGEPKSTGPAGRANEALKRLGY